MSLSTRDREAFELLGTRSFANAFVVSLALEMQTRRLTLRVYGSLHGGASTHIAGIAFFGVEALAMEGADGGFPGSALIASLELTYDDAADQGHAHIAGAHGWTIAFDFDGMAFEETAGTISSLADDEA